MRGQLFSFDFILSVSLLIFVFAITLFVSDSVANAINEKEVQRDLKIAADAASAQLVETPGNPPNWNVLEFSEGNVKSMGIANERNVLNENKTARFFEILNRNFENYTLMKRMLALDLPSSNFSVTIYNSSGAKLFESAVGPAKDASIYSVQRVAVLQNKPVLVNVRVWVERK